MIYNQKLLDSVGSTPCSQCDNEALLRCDKTHLYFCSITCNQLLMEPRAFEAPLPKNEIRYDEAIKTGDRVVITGIINEKCLYVRRADADVALLLNRIHKITKQAEKLQEYPAIGNLVLARLDDEVYRSEVIDVFDDGVIAVRLLDYGNTACVSLDELMKMDTACKNLKCSTHKVCLKNVNVDAINDLIIETFNDLLVDKTELLVKEADHLGMELTIQSTNESLNNKIMEISEVPRASYNQSGVRNEVNTFFVDTLQLFNLTNYFC